jgi:hypothetical protein
VMPACETGGFSDVLEDDGAGFDESPGSDRAVLTVELGCLGAGVGHSSVRGLRGWLAGSWRLLCKQSWGRGEKKNQEKDGRPNHF